MNKYQINIDFRVRWPNRRRLSAAARAAILLVSASIPAVLYAAGDQDSTKAVRDATDGVMNIGQMVQVTLGLILVLALIVTVAWLVKRFSGYSFVGSGALRTLGGMSVGARERVVLVQIGERQLLLGVAPGRIETLYVLEEPIAIDGGQQNKSGQFAQKLASAMKQRAPS